MQNGDRSTLDENQSKNDYYVLSTDFFGTTRLALQHYIWHQALGFNIHPSIPEPGPEAAVADVACGTALWLVEVGRQIGPSSDLHAFDINLNQAPPQRWLPKNLGLHEWNLFDDVPSEFVGRFDLVHVRLITVIIKDNNPNVIMKNLCKLLKPGGHLQWDEIDVVGSFVAKAYPELEAPGIEAYFAWMVNRKLESKNSTRDEWKDNAVELFRQNGFDPVERYDLKHKFLENMELMRYNHDQIMMTLEQHCRKFLAAGHEEGFRLLKMVEEAAKDAEKGAIVIIPPFCWIAQKTT